MTIEIQRSFFVRYGIHDQIVTDNRPFFSDEFEHFLSKNHMIHMTSPPFHPSSNGAAENAVKRV